LSQAFGGWILAAGIIALTVIVYIGKIIEMSRGHADPGVTTEVALLLMFAVGAYLVVGDRAAAIAIGGGAAVLLHFKGELHGAVARLGAGDLKAVMQFALISLVMRVAIFSTKNYDRAFLEVVNATAEGWRPVVNQENPG
jgi:uncharacterized membrane protein (DUF4010 family)